MIRSFIFCMLACLLALPGQAAQLRAIVSSQEAPAGFTVLDHRGDLWLISGTEVELKALPGARIMSETRPAATPRTFTPDYSPVVDGLVAQVHAGDLIAQIEWLVGLGVRFSQVPNLLAVADSLDAKLASFGLPTERHYFPMGSLTVPNVIATKIGSVEPDSVFVICAHYDATSNSAQFNTPGADDNGSGTATLLTAARLLAGLQTHYTIKFVLFAGEEQGLVGSGHWVSDMADEGLPILGALNFDMMGWWTEGVPFDLEIETNVASQWLADAICWAADTYTTMPYELHVDNGAWWGDFYPFWQNGFAAVNHEESWDWFDPDFNPYYHSTSDTVDKLSPEFLEGGARIGVAALASLAGIVEVSAVGDVPLSAGNLVASPNPFNGRIVLSLSAAGAQGPHAVTVYDLRGQRVDQFTLNVNDGRGQAVWDARDKGGRPLPAGVYLARVKTLPGQPSCRMVYVP